ncbi:MAG: pyridoxal phosphate-dependent aminotransferase [Phycisphaerales bacterium]
MDIARLISDRARSVDASGIRRVVELGKKMPDKIDLSIGQPDFDVPAAIKKAACDAINSVPDGKSNRNGYTANPGLDALQVAIARRLEAELGWHVRAPGMNADSPTGMFITTGTASALALAYLAVLGPGDEIIIPDPYFTIYPEMAKVCHAKAVACDTYPDFRLTAARVAPLITPRTKMVLLNSPGNPSGAVMTSAECDDLLALCRGRGILLISDEIYDEFTFSESRTEPPANPSSLVGLTPGTLLCPSPARRARAEEDVLLIRGFGKTYGITGWRLGYAVGPMALIEQMVKLQQHTIVCAPTPLQWGAVAALETDMRSTVAHYEQRRNRVYERLSRVAEVSKPGGAYYAFPRIPPKLGLTAQQFADKLVERKVLVIPGNVFSTRDTHIRISFAVRDDILDRGIDEICRAMGG